MPPAWERRLVGRVVSVWQGNRAGGPWLPPAHLKWEPLAFEGAGGATLAGRWFPAEEPRGTVVLVHPARRYAKHWFEREGWVDFLHDRRFDVLTFDLAGWGESRGHPYHPADVARAVEVAHRWAGGQPVHLVGVSMGAFFAANAAPHMVLDGLVLESPYPTWADWYGRGPGRLAARMFEAAFPRTARFLHADENLAKAQARRILVAAAGDDDLTPVPLTERVANAGPAERTRYHVVPGAKHLEPFRNAAYREAVLATLSG